MVSRLSFNLYFFPLLENEILFLQEFRQPEFNFISISRGVIPVFRGHHVSVTMLRKDVIRLKLVDEDQRLIDVRVMLCGRKEKRIDMSKHKGEHPKSPKEWNPHIPDELSDLILKCLEKDKGNRFHNADEVRSELDNIEKGLPTTDQTPAKRKTITSKPALT